MVEKLKVKPASDQFLIIRLKQLCKERKINFEFPEMIEEAPNFDSMGGNPYSQNNPFDAQNNNFNRYASNMGPGNNNYGNN